MKSTGTWSSNGLQWLDLKIGHQDRSPINGHQAISPYFVRRWCRCFHSSVLRFSSDCPDFMTAASCLSSKWNKHNCCHSNLSSARLPRRSSERPVLMMSCESVKRCMISHRHSSGSWSSMSLPSLSRWNRENMGVKIKLANLTINRYCCDDF